LFLHRYLKPTFRTSYSKITIRQTHLIEAKPFGRIELMLEIAGKFLPYTDRWHGVQKPLVSRAVIVNLIGHTKTRTGLTINAKLDDNAYPTGIKVSDVELAAVRIKRARFHGDWNYTILPRV
jgi:hypothetical protein